MVFSSMTFLLLFLPGLLLFYFPAVNIRWRNGVLIAASLVFYAWGEPVYVLFMVFSTAVNYFCAQAIGHTENPQKQKAAMMIGVGVSLALLFYFKYFAFLCRNITGLFGGDPVKLQIRLPIGISFYTFQVLTYTIDVWRRKVPVQKSFAKLLLYVSCFPQLIAGPIVQYSDIVDELDARTITPSDFTEGMRRFITGLSKKVLLANICGAAVEALPQGDAAGAMSVFGAWYMTFLYGLQIFFDFSAYSDMAIGLGRVLGFHYKENFRYPYTALSVSEFWRRWHISLGSFFREYVYIPLGGNRKGAARTAFNILLVWTLTGFWHGADWNFLLWGLYFGFILLLERTLLKKIMEKTPKPLRWLFAELAVLLSWVIFYHTDLSSLGNTFLAMLGLAHTAEGFTRLPLIDPVTQNILKQYSFYPLIPFLFAFPVVPFFRSRLESTPGGERVLSVLQIGLPLLLLALSVVFLVGQTYNPFIYFRF
ncbi:MAG: MBOAT family protein [Oscillospiraceae bacterium]|nr:MBOAT family protein [Oscillospiraceae bacterium]